MLLVNCFELIKIEQVLHLDLLQQCKVKLFGGVNCFTIAGHVAEDAVISLLLGRSKLNSLDKKCLLTASSLEELQPLQVAVSEKR